jgi:hypothetical protein
MLTTTIILQIAVLIYYVITTLVDLFPFNGARFATWREKIAECAINSTFLVIPPLIFFLHSPRITKASFCIYFFVFIGGVATWFIPYFFGAGKKFQAIYDRIQKNTIHIFPPRGNHPAPNLEHTILLTLALATGIMTLFAHQTQG